MGKQCSAKSKGINKAHREKGSSYSVTHMHPFVTTFEWKGLYQPWNQKPLLLFSHSLHRPGIFFLSCQSAKGMNGFQIWAQMKWIWIPAQCAKGSGFIKAHAQPDLGTSAMCLSIDALDSTTTTHTLSLYWKLYIPYLYMYYVNTENRPCLQGI